MKRGRFTFRFGWLTVAADDLALWKQHPNAAFTLVSTLTADAEDEFRLGTFELWEYLSQRKVGALQNARSRRQMQCLSRSIQFSQISFSEQQALIKLT